MIGEQKGAAWTDLVNKGQLTAAIDQLQPAEKLPDGVNQDSLAFRLLMEQKHVVSSFGQLPADKKQQALCFLGICRSCHRNHHINTSVALPRV